MQQLRRMIRGQCFDSFKLEGSSIINQHVEVMGCLE